MEVAIPERIVRRYGASSRRQVDRDETDTDVPRLAEASGIEMTRSIPDAPAFLSP
jgi:hypothetical protein